MIGTGDERTADTGGHRPGSKITAQVIGVDAAGWDKFNIVGRRTQSLEIGRTQGVGRATTNSVVAGSVAVLVVDFFVTKILFSVLY